MNRYKIGIIGGAGPSAGSLFFEQIIRYCQKKYNCKKDDEFPHINLINFPFSDMLSNKTDNEIIKKELYACIDELIKSDCKIIAIACNTLHAFLPNKLTNHIKLIHMIEETRKAIQQKVDQKPLILCSSTSAKYSLHYNFFDCVYVDEEHQKMLDAMILQITEGKKIKTISQNLSFFLEKVHQKKPVILGCTEFSYLNEKFPLARNHIYDPSRITSERMIDIYFENQIRDTVKDEAGRL